LFGYIARVDGGRTLHGAEPRSDPRFRGFVSYLRVSTQRQGDSGLGLEAQRIAVAAHVAGGEVLAEYLETESGGKNDRPQLRAALAHAQVTGATLIIAKLDRLARNLAFIANLMEGGVDFIAADLPAATRLTIHVLAAVAEHEREMISARTKAAMAAAKARGVHFGNPNGARALRAAAQGNTAALAALQCSAAAWRARVLPIILAIRSSGLISPHEIAGELTRRGVRTARGGRWRAETVRAIIGSA
jgi:DNA invertase Pin-like site-specific DNA recombinase